jgi:hypothetical protein
MLRKNPGYMYQHPIIMSIKNSRALQSISFLQPREDSHDGHQRCSSTSQLAAQTI